MEAVKRLHAFGLFHGEWAPTAEAAAQAAYHMRAAAAVEFDLRALYDADDRAAAMEKSRSSSPDATPGTTSGAISSASRKHAAVTQSNNTTGVPETLHGDGQLGRDSAEARPISGNKQQSKAPPTGGARLPHIADAGRSPPSSSRLAVAADLVDGPT